jgi:3-oxoacyl-[acyl-carrier-protein] synthase-3
MFWSREDRRRRTSTSSSRTRQTNAITEAVADRLNVDLSNVYSNIAVHGNTSSASIPIALDECVEAGRVKPGDLVLMASFGGGVTWGAVLMRW